MYNYMSYNVYKNSELSSSGVCDRERVQNELINDLISNIFYKDCKITMDYYKKIKVVYTRKIASDNYKIIRVYENK